MTVKEPLEEGIPENERWLHEPEVKAKIDRALARAERTPHQETDLDELEERLRLGIRRTPAGPQTPPD